MPTRDHARRRVPILLLLIGVAVWLVLRQSPAPRNPPPAGVEFLARSHAEFKGSSGKPEMEAPPTVNSAAIQAAETEQVGAEEAQDVAEHGTNDPFAGEEFVHVPSWLPRLPAVSVIAEDATLRSDGLREGTVHYEIEAGREDAAMEAARQALQTNGFREDSENGEFLREDPPAACRLSFVKRNAKSSRLSAVYHDGGHGDGCACPGCGGPAPEPP